MTLQSLAERLKLIEPRSRVNYAAAVASSPSMLQAYPSYDLAGTAALGSAFYRIPERQDLQLLARLRELIPVLDMAIVWLRLLIGTPCVEADDAIQEEIKVWMEELEVNRVQRGFALWLASHIDNGLLYGRAHAEIIPTNRRDDVFGLVEVAPLTTALRPQADRYHLDVVQYGHGGEPITLDPNLLVTTVFDVRGDDPNGTSLLYGIPLIGEIYAKMVSNLGEAWERFGVPSVTAVWVPPNTLNDPNGDTTKRVGDGARAQLTAIDQARQNGRKQHLVLAGEWNLGVLGAQGEVLTFNIDAQALMEQVCAKTKLPPFLFGLQWATTERMSTTQAILLNEVIESYQEAVTPGLKKLIALRLALAGRKADFSLSWEHTSLQDRMENARADWMDAQAQQIDLENQQDQVRLGIYTIEEMAQHFRPELEGLTPDEVRRRLKKLVTELPEPKPPPAPFGGGNGGPPPRGPAGPTGEGMRGLVEDEMREWLTNWERMSYSGNGNGKQH